MGRLLPVCLICKQVPEQGVAQGMCICGSFICSDCERKLVENRPCDTGGLRRLAAKLR